MKKDQEKQACQTETQPHQPHPLSSYDLAPLAVLAVFMVLFLEFLPELRLWLLGFLMCAVLARLAYAYFRKQG
ncbi:MAG: hypothetical protein WBL07_13085 [Thiothrix litoralis]|uniref:hypothetical protein n=1 Tax=Thiothrix litoralis TaxID=2891210 RepID=UPI003C71F5D1